MGRQRTWNSQKITEKEQNWRFMLPDSKSYYTVTVLKTVRTGEKRDRDQCNKIEMPK